MEARKARARRLPSSKYKRYETLGKAFEIFMAAM